MADSTNVGKAWGITIKTLHEAVGMTVDLDTGVDALTAAVSQNHLRARPLTAESVPQMNLEKSMALYRDRFADASDFTFVFVWSFDLVSMRPLVERYIGSLPGTGRRETWKDVGVHPPTGIVEKRVLKGIEPKSRASVVASRPTADAARMPQT